MSSFTEAIDRGLQGINHVSAGACPGCEECGLEHIQEPKEDQSAYACANEGSFSRYACDACGSTLGGDRYPAHGTIDGEIIHLDTCADCLMYLANGEKPEQWYRSSREI